MTIYSVNIVLPQLEGQFFHDSTFSALNAKCLNSVREAEVTLTLFHDLITSQIKFKKFNLTDLYVPNM